MNDPSKNIDPEFLSYLSSLPVEFLEELFITWVLMKNSNKKIPVIDIDAIHKVKQPTKTKITNDEIKDFYSFLKNNKVDISKINKGGSDE